MLDYDIQVQKLQEEDRMFDSGPLGNYSLAGFEMVLDRHVSHYIINYYLPSGLFVAVSWISFLVPSDIIPGQHCTFLFDDAKVLSSFVLWSEVRRKLFRLDIIECVF